MNKIRGFTTWIIVALLPRLVNHLFPRSYLARNGARKLLRRVDGAYAATFTDRCHSFLMLAPLLPETGECQTFAHEPESPA